MSDRATTLKERLKQRRSRMQEASGALSEEDKTPRRTDRTWDASMEEEEGSRSGYASLEMEEEVKESEKLVKSLKKKRKKVKQELDETVRTQEKREDVGAELRRAKQKTKKKVKDAEERSATEAEETAASAEELLDSDRQTPRDKTPRGKPPSRDRTPRGKSSRDVTPRDEAKAEEVDDAVVHTTTSEALMQEAHDTQPLIEKEDSSKKTLEDKKKTRRGQGLGESYRKKLADKMKAAKDKGKDEAYDSGVRMFKDKRGQPMATRFDTADEMRKEDIELEESLQQTITARQKLRDAAAKAKAGDESFASARMRFATRMDHIPTPEEAFDFFTRQWEPDPEQDKLDDERRKKKKVPTATLR